MFVAYVEQVLVAELRAGDVMVMDHLRCHQVDGVRAAMEGAKCRLLYQPP